MYTCIMFVLFVFYLGVVGIQWIAIMGLVTKEVENY